MYLTFYFLGDPLWFAIANTDTQCKLYSLMLMKIHRRINSLGVTVCSNINYAIRAAIYFQCNTFTKHVHDL